MKWKKTVKNIVVHSMMIRLILALILSLTSLSAELISIDHVENKGKQVDVKVSSDELIKFSLWTPGEPLPLPIQGIVSKTVNHLSEGNKTVMIQEVELKNGEFKIHGKQQSFWYYKIHYRSNSGGGVVFKLLNGSIIDGHE